MIKIYVMESCPDCTQVKKQVKNDDRFQLIDIGQHVINLKEFTRLRDQNPNFADAKKNGYIGIPCFLFEDGTVSFSPSDAGLNLTSDEEDRPMCNIDGTGC